MAECLAESPVKTEDFFTIYVANKDTKNYVEHIASKILAITCSTLMKINLLARLVYDRISNRKYS